MTPSLKHRTSSAWSMEDEITFLDGMGTWNDTGSQDRKTSPMTRQQLLEGYIKALDLRVRWGHIDEAQIRAHAAALLK